MFIIKALLKISGELQYESLDEITKSFYVNPSTLMKTIV